MRIFVAFEGSFEAFDVSAHESVEAIKQMVKDYFHIPLSEDQQGRRYLELTYAGAALRNSWSLSDVGISFCSTLKCFVKTGLRASLGDIILIDDCCGRIHPTGGGTTPELEKAIRSKPVTTFFHSLCISCSFQIPALPQKEDKPTLYVFNAVTWEMMPIMENTSILGKKVSDLRVLVTLRCGFPVSVYCLRTPKGLEMYDCNALRDYQIDIGATLRLDVWDGWKEFLMGCLLGQKPKVQRYLSKEGPVLKYQKRVALYIAAFHGHTELTEWALKQGVQPHEAVGAHPYRAWCHEALHTDVSNCPIHAAAEAGQLLILKAFVNCSVLCLECKNAAGQTPITIAAKHQHKDCVLYLLSKMWSTVSFPKLSVPMRIYIKIKQWILRAQSHTCRKNQLGRARVSGAKVGDILVVDGFTKPKMTSKSWHKAGDKSWQSQCCKLPPCKQQSSRNPVDSFVISQRDTRKQITFPALANTNKFSGLQSHHQENQKNKTTPARRREKHIKNACLPRVPLPPGSRVDYPHPLFYCGSPGADSLLRSLFTSFSEHSGKTPRENAIYCLAVASAFKEKRWLQQLEIARVLAKKSISNLTVQGNPAKCENLSEIML